MLKVSQKFMIVLLLTAAGSVASAIQLRVKTNLFSNTGRVASLRCAIQNMNAPDEVYDILSGTGQIDVADVAPTDYTVDAGADHYVVYTISGNGQVLVRAYRKDLKMNQPIGDLNFRVTESSLSNGGNRFYRRMGPLLVSCTVRPGNHF